MGLPRKGGVAFGERVDIPDWPDQSRTYLTRWILFRCPWFAIYLHCIRMPDADRHLHDHPWSFVSIVLRGGYDEQRPRRNLWPAEVAEVEPRQLPYKRLQIPCRTVRRGWLSVARRKATDLHRVLNLHRVPTWTLLFVSGRTRDWGFVTQDRGWVDHETYFHPKSREQVGT